MVPRDPFFKVKMVRPWKFGPGHVIWKDSLHVGKSFPCLLLLHFHKSLFPSGTFLWLVGKFSPVTALGASASAPIIKHTTGLFQGKPATLGDFFSFVVTYLGCLMLLTTCSAEPYPFHKRQLQSNIVLVLGLLFQVRTKFFREKWKMVWADHYSWNFGPPNQFFAGPKFPWQNHPKTHVKLVHWPGSPCCIVGQKTSQ